MYINMYLNGSKLILNVIIIFFYNRWSWTLIEAVTSKDLKNNKNALQDQSPFYNYFMINFHHAGTPVWLNDFLYYNQKRNWEIQRYITMKTIYNINE